jgi:hypothetical protein
MFETEYKCFVIEKDDTVHMNVNRKKIPVQTISQMGGEESS